MACAPTLSLRVLTCQTDGCLGKSVGENIARWREKLLGKDGLNSATDLELDVIHFPETAFMRYYYAGKEDFKAYGAAEVCGGQKESPVFLFAKELATHFGAYVIVGYAEKEDVSEEKDLSVTGTVTGESTSEVGAGVKTKTNYYNSLYVLGRDGALLLNHRKRDLFQPDYVWAVPSGRPHYSTALLKNRGGQEFNAGLIVCQEILGPQENVRMGMDCAVTNQFAAQGDVHVVFFSTCWPIGGGKLDFPPPWEKAVLPMVVMRDGAPCATTRELLFCAADGCGSEKNCLTAEQWGGFEKYEELRQAEVLRKRGCSGVKKIKAIEAVSAASSDQPAGEKEKGPAVEGTLIGGGDVMGIEEEGWRIFDAEIVR